MFLDGARDERGWRDWGGSKQFSLRSEPKERTVVVPSRELGGYVRATLVNVCAIARQEKGQRRDAGRGDTAVNGDWVVIIRDRREVSRCV